MLYVLTIYPYGHKGKTARVTFDQGQRELVYGLQRNLIIRGHHAELTEVLEAPIQTASEKSMAQQYLAIGVEPLNIPEWEQS